MMKGLDHTGPSINQGCPDNPCVDIRENEISSMVTLKSSHQNQIRMTLQNFGQGLSFSRMGRFSNNGSSDIFGRLQFFVLKIFYCKHLWRLFVFPSLFEIIWILEILRFLIIFENSLWSLSWNGLAVRISISFSISNDFENLVIWWWTLVNDINRLKIRVSGSARAKIAVPNQLSQPK